MCFGQISHKKQHRRKQGSQSVCAPFVWRWAPFEMCNEDNEIAVCCCPIHSTAQHSTAARWQHAVRDVPGSQGLACTRLCVSKRNRCQPSILFVWLAGWLSSLFPLRCGSACLSVSVFLLRTTTTIEIRSLASLTLTNLTSRSSSPRPHQGSSVIASSLVSDVAFHLLIIRTSGSSRSLFSAPPSPGFWSP